MLVFVIFFILLRLSGGSSDPITCGDKVSQTIVVDQTGRGEFRTVQAAVNSIPEKNSHWIKIQINRGTYLEQLQIHKSCIILEGESRQLTTISYNAHQSTDLSPTFDSDSPHVVVRHITFKNTYSIEQNDIIQAVAVKVLGDKSAFYDCGFIGIQDTLWDAGGRHYFKNCYIEGAIDFIFGQGQSFYEDCQINATAGTLSSKVSIGYITAQNRESESEPSGFVFLGGNVVGNAKVFLGRAWGPYSRVIFIKTNLGSNIVPEGWNPWQFEGEETKLTYAEVRCEGGGSDLSKRVPWMTKLGISSAMKLYSRDHFINQDRWISHIPIN